MVIGAAQEYEAADGMSLEIEAPRIGEGPAGRRGIDAENVAVVCSQDVALRAFLKFGEASGLEAMDNFSLPEAIERFDGGLKTTFAWRRKNRNDVESKAESDDAAEGIGNIVWSLEACVVVELSIGGQAVLAPMVFEHGEDEIGGDALARPGCDEPAMQRHGVERMSVVCVHEIVGGLLKERDVFDDVKRVELGLATGEIGEIPAWGRRGTTDATTSIEHAMTCEDTADGSHRRQSRQELFAEMPIDGRGTKLAQSAVLLQMASRIEDEAFDVRRDASGSRGCGRAIGEIDTMQTLSSGALNPALHSP